VIQERTVHPSATAAFGRTAPGVPVQDVDRAVAFYVDVLGMTVTFSNGDPVGFVIVRRGPAEFHLTRVRERPTAGHNIAHLLVEDARGLHDHLVAHGVRIVKGLRDADHGLRGFVFCDPDGNRIDVGEPLG
jgi:catechol 2,3-dioxygenase-like lactoylglutathione lyase family enzyme